MMGTGANRRRSQRLFLQVPIVIEGQATGKPNFVEKSRTVVVNAHGALVEMSVPLEQGSTVNVKNIRTNEAQESKVILVTAGDPENSMWRWNLRPPTSFWRVSFPPDDWSVRHPDAKRNR